MGHHLTPDGQFKSDKYDWCPVGFIALKFTDPIAQAVLLIYASRTGDRELADDIREAVRAAAPKKYCRLCGGDGQFRVCDGTEDGGAEECPHQCRGEQPCLDCVQEGKEGR